MKVFQDNTQLLIKLSQTYLHEEHRHTIECVFFYYCDIIKKSLNKIFSNGKHSKHKQKINKKDPSTFDIASLTT